MKHHVTSASPSGGTGQVPPRALFISVLALAVPVGVTVVMPEWASDTGVLIWLSALVPPFLLTFYRGWQGASLALAAGMAALALAEVVRVGFTAVAPQEGVILWIVSSLIAVSLGAGGLSEMLHRARRQAEGMALTDGLTGLPNRRHATVFLESSFAAARRGTPLSVALFDLDGFKAVNDSHGHAEGDRVLVRFAALLRQRTRDMNLTGRWGGEEFISVLSQSDAQGAKAFAESVRQALAQEAFPWGGVTVSAGVADYQEGMATPEVLVAAADQALYRAKEEGRDRVAVTASFPTRPATPRGAHGAPPVAQRASPVAHRASPSAQRAPPVPAPEPARDMPPRGRGEVVLVVDDDRDARRSVARALARFGYHVLEAEGPEEALEITRGREEPPDLLVTDVIMPTMSGFRLVEMLQRGGLTPRVLYMSGYAQEGVDWEGVPGAAREFLSKPMSLEDLAAAVARLLDHPTAPEEAHRPARPEVPAEPVTSADETVPTRGWGPDPQEMRGARILVVDDDPAAAESLARLLRRLGFGTVRTSTDPAEIPSLLARFDPDAMLLDLHMPGVGGIEVLEAVRPFLEGPSFVPVVAITGDQDPELRRRALLAGASDFITKPPESWELEVRLRNLLHIRFTTRRLAEQAGELEARVTARTAELEEARTESLLRLARAAEYRDDLTGRHAERVGKLSALLGEVLGVEPALQDLLHRAAPLHDVGKIGIPDSILRKPGALSDSEFETMRQHTLIGAEILGGSRVPVLSAARDIALHHHERWDGSGYPCGLVGGKIPLMARIVAVADVHDSLTHDRPYRKALSLGTALDHLREGSGTLFDPEVVEALMEVHRSGGIEEIGQPEMVGRSLRPSGPVAG